MTENQKIWLEELIEEHRENQKIWLEELIEEHRVAASNERLWSKGADDEEQARMHEENAEEHIEFANMLTTLFKNIGD